LFADAGNIWLLEEDPNQPGGKFESKDFLDELAVGAGFGLRIDISYFVLRLDMAWPIRKPYLPAGERWIHPLRDEHPILNIAIGYPF
jgi:outer membrane protein assembly factor BamA